MFGRTNRKRPGDNEDDEEMSRNTRKIPDVHFHCNADKSVLCSLPILVVIAFGLLLNAGYWSWGTPAELLVQGRRYTVGGEGGPGNGKILRGAWGSENHTSVEGEGDEERDNLASTVTRTGVTDEVNKDEGSKDRKEQDMREENKKRIAMRQKREEEAAKEAAVEEEFAKIEQLASEHESKYKVEEWLPVIHNYPPTTGLSDEELSKLVDPDKKYMYHFLFNDVCAGLLHYGSTLWGMVGEARYLNRILVWLPMGLGPHHNRGRLELKDPGVFFDKAKILKEWVEVIPLADFLAGVAYWEKQGKELKTETITPSEDSKLKVGSDAVILTRNYTDNWGSFAFQLRDYVPMPSESAEYAPHLKQLLEDLIKVLPDDFDVVHVRRGDKAMRKSQWPNLDNDTQPDKLVEKISKLVEPNRYLYIASNENKKGFFDPLKAIFKVIQLQDFKYLWAEKSAWWNGTIDAVGPIPAPTFDGYQAGYLDYGVLRQGKKRVETFNDLTDDPWQGFR